MAEVEVRKGCARMGVIMAFAIRCVLVGYEVRGVQSGTSKKGSPWRALRLEDAEGHGCEVSTSKADYFPAIDACKRGDLVTCDCIAVAGRERSYIMLADAPQVTGNAYQGDATGVGY